MRNRAWFYLGKVWYQRGYLEESERALRQVSDKIDPRINAERYMLLAQLMMQQGRYDDAIAALSNWHGAPDWTAYAQFNLGVALVRKDRLAEAIRYLDRVGRIETSSEELLSLKDKANLALGFALLQAQRAADAKPILQRVRLEGPYSSKALLGVGWADAGMGEFKRALVPVAGAAQAQPARLGGAGILSHRAVCLPAACPPRGRLPNTTTRRSSPSMRR